MVLSASAINLKSMTMGVILGNKWQCETYDVDQRRKKKKNKTQSPKSSDVTNLSECRNRE